MDFSFIDDNKKNKTLFFSARAFQMYLFYSKIKTGKFKLITVLIKSYYAIKEVEFLMVKPC